MKNNLMRLGFILIAISSISACTPNTSNQLALQQHYICKSLIQGFLKTQKLSHYELSNTTPDLSEISEQRIYRYKTTSDTNIRLNMPSQAHLMFRCDMNQQHYALQLVNAQQSIPLMTLNMPKPEMMEMWTAFELKNNNQPYSR